MPLVKIPHLHHGTIVKTHRGDQKHCQGAIKSKPKFPQRNHCKLNHKKWRDHCTNPFKRPPWEYFQISHKRFLIVDALWDFLVVFFLNGPFYEVFIAMLWHYRSLPKWLLCDVIGAILQSPRCSQYIHMVLTLGQLYNCLDDFHNCFISDTLRAFSKCPFNGISETFDKFLCWDHRSMYFHNCLWLLFLLCCVSSSEFFSSFQKSHRMVGS